MKILWISNIPFGPLCELAGGSNSNSGSWLDAAYDALKNVDQLELIIVTTGFVKEIKTQKDGPHTFCLLPGGRPKNYNHKSAKNRLVWEKLYLEYKPDIIQCWGTEFSQGYLALQVMKNVPSVIYMQGVMSQIARYYTAGMSDSELIKSITLRDIIKSDWIKRQKNDFLERSKIEACMIKLSGNVIVENQWCKAHCEAIAIGCKSYFSKLNVKSEFFEHCWTYNNMEPYSILAVAAGVPLKGLHILLKAFNLVLKKYPQAKLYVPGITSPLVRSLKERLLIYGYASFIRKLIIKCGLKDNVVFMGRINSKTMAEKMAKSNLFVLPSSIENHSSALIEAMIIGTPCISSNVGGIAEYLNHNTNGLLYRFEEFEILAFHILRIFDDRGLAEEFSKSSSSEMRMSRKSSDIQNELLSIYKEILNVRNN